MMDGCLQKYMAAVCFSSVYLGASRIHGREVICYQLEFGK